MIYQVVLQLTGGGLKVFAVAEAQAAAIQQVKAFLGAESAVSAVVRDKYGKLVWSGSE